MRTIDPNLFTRLMLLPETARFDLLEFVGATALADIQLSDLIEDLFSKAIPERAALQDPH